MSQIIKTKFLCKTGCRTARIRMSIIFQLDIEELKDNKINEILKIR